SGAPHRSPWTASSPTSNHRRNAALGILTNQSTLRVGMPEDILHGHPASQRFTKDSGDAKCTLNSEAAFSPLDPGQECLVVAASSCKLDEREARLRSQLLQFHLSSPPTTTDTNLLPIVIVAFSMPVVNMLFAFWHRD